MRDEIAAALHAAQSGTDKRRTCTLRLVSAALRDRDEAQRAAGRPRLGDSEIAEMLGRMVAQRECASRRLEEAGNGAEALLERHGVLTRGAVMAEQVAGGFSAVYPVLRAFEENGRARRGYFVETLGAAQFGTPGSVDRLRGFAAPDRAPAGPVVLAATDPALMTAFLSHYSVSTGDAVFRRWRELAESILTKHVDGYVKDPKGMARAPGYSKEWLQRIVEARPDQFTLPKNRAPVETDH